MLNGDSIHLLSILLGPQSQKQHKKQTSKQITNKQTKKQTNKHISRQKKKIIITITSGLHLPQLNYIGHVHMGSKSKPVKFDGGTTMISMV